MIWLHLQVNTHTVRLVKELLGETIILWIRPRQPFGSHQGFANSIHLFFGRKGTAWRGGRQQIRRHRVNIRRHSQQGEPVSHNLRSFSDNVSRKRRCSQTQRRMFSSRYIYAFSALESGSSSDTEILERPSVVVGVMSLAGIPLPRCQHPRTEAETDEAPGVLVKTVGTCA